MAEDEKIFEPYVMFYQNKLFLISHINSFKSTEEHTLIQKQNDAQGENSASSV